MKLQTSGVLGTSYAIAKLAPKREYIDKKYSTNEEDNATHYINNKAFVPLQKELKYPYVDKIITSTTFTHNRSYFTDHVDKYVYPTIDAVSVLFSIFAPSLDAIPDGIGLFYSTLRGNTGNISNYTIALTIPAASALSVTAVKLTVAKQQGKNVYRIVNNTVEATANATDEAARELLTKYLAQGDISQEAYNQLINKQGKELSDGLLKAIDDEYDRFYKALTDNAGAGVQGVGSDFINAFKPGYSIESITAIPKGSRPTNPSTYLKEEYITNHLTKFEDGAVRFTSRNSFNQYGTLGPDGGFVLSKSDFDKIIKETGGDLRQIEQKLGLDANYLDGSDVMIVHIDNPSAYNLRIPSGNEGGANQYWLPGGKTSGGVNEAVMDFSNSPNFTEIILE